MNFREIQIDSPEEIYGAVRHTAENAEDQLYRVALNHDHISTVRGYGEQTTDLSDKLGEDSIEFRREDGGNTWYHSPESRCIMLGVPSNSDKNADEMMRAWGKALTRKLDDYIGQNDFDSLNPLYVERDDFSTRESWDVYDRNSGRQLFGLSMRDFEDSAVLRACFYNGKDHGELFEKMLEEDNQDYREFNDRYIPLEGFYDWLIDSNRSEEIDFQVSQESLDLDNSFRRAPSPCIVRLESLN